MYFFFINVYVCVCTCGLTRHCSSLQGVVVALDKSAARLKLVENNCARLGVSCVRTYAFDGRKSVASPSAECPIGELVTMYKFAPHLVT